MPHKTLSREQVREVDRLALEQYGMSGLVLMENAGRGCVDVLQSLGARGPVVVCCGKGNNAGDGFVIARHLDLRRIAVRVLMWSPPEDLSGDALANYRILAKCDVPMHQLEGAGEPLQQQLDGADWIVDALLGTGAKGAPRPPLDAVILALNAAPSMRLAVDLPSGLDCDTGQPADVTFRADHTCTFVASKRGFAADSARAVLGQVHVLDIGAPRKLIDHMMNAST
ncbi:MAG: NAD(P)H-hydrate epimerase [Pirellulaceae bacterium]